MRPSIRPRNPRVAPNFLSLIAVLAACLQTPARAETPTPIGDDFQVNTTTTGSQDFSDVAMAPDGTFLVVWNGDEGGALLDGIFAQRFGPDGSPVGAEQAVNSFQNNQQNNPATTALTDGRFVVVWSSYGSPGDDNSYYSVQARLVDLAGELVGDQFQVNNNTDGYQNAGDVAAMPDGGFVVVWSSDAAPSDNAGIVGRLFNSDGLAISDEFQINGYTTGNQALPRVDASPDGRFVVAWSTYGASSGDDDDGLSVHIRHFDSFGAPIGDELQVNTYTTGHQWRPDIELDGDGDVVVTWMSAGSPTDHSGDSVQARLFDSTGQPITGEVQVNETTLGAQARGRLTMQDGGAFVVAWESFGSGSHDGVFVRAFDADGTSTSGEIRINSQVEESFSPSIDGTGDDLAATWTSFVSPGDDDSGTSVLGRRLVLALFADGFESGDTSAWSSQRSPESP